MAASIGAPPPYCSPVLCDFTDREGLRATPMPLVDEKTVETEHGLRHGAQRRKRDVGSKRWQRHWGPLAHLLSKCSPQQQQQQQTDDVRYTCGLLEAQYLPEERCSGTRCNPAVAQPPLLRAPIAVSVPNLITVIISPPLTLTLPPARRSPQTGQASKPAGKVESSESDRHALLSLYHTQRDRNHAVVGHVQCTHHTFASSARLEKQRCPVLGLPQQAPCLCILRQHSQMCLHVAVV